VKLYFVESGEEGHDYTPDLETKQETFEEKLYQSCKIWKADGNLEKELEELETRTKDLLESKEEEKSVQKNAKEAYALTSPPTIPWLLRFRSTLDHTSSFHSLHDYFTNPPVCILIASTGDKLGGSTNPIDCLAELANKHHLPKSFSNGLLDPQALRREFVLLHDEVDGPATFDDAKALREMQARFGMGCCAIIRINSEKGEEGEEEDIWENWTGAFWSYYNQTVSEQGENPPPKKKRGLCLSVNDKLAIRRYIATMITAGLLPALERRISTLNMNVSNAKKGVKNVFKNLLFRGKKDTGLSNASVHGFSGVSTHGRASFTAAKSVGGEPEVRYRFDSIEAQVRLLADTLFLMRDYEASLSMYKLVKDDYKHDRCLLHYASVHEMMGLCYYLLDPYGTRYSRDFFNMMETALYNYARAAEEETVAAGPAIGGSSGGRPTLAPTATRLATRLCLVLTSTKQMYNNRHMEIADLLASASSHETPLGAAVLLEQSSSHYFQSGMYRKYAFHMLMAGHMFRSAEQEQHAFRCFTSALYVYHGGKWDELHNHLRSSLAAQLYSMGRMSVALQLYAKLVGTTGGGRVSVRSQQKFLSHLVDICRGFKDDALIGADRMWDADDDDGSTKKTNDKSNSTVNAFEDVLRVTPDAMRLLEIPNMDLPRVLDSSLAVSVEDAAVAGDRGATLTFGTVSPGTESVWQDLMCSVQAELRADAENNDDIETVIDEIDKEKADLAFLARSKERAGASAAAPEVRARMEPLTVKFAMSNPLSVQIQLSEIQLVARLTSSENGRVCTSEGAVVIPGKEGERSKTWSFHSSRKAFVMGDFTRTSPTKGDDDEDGDKPWVSPNDDEEGPFFVVDKTNLAVDPGTSTEVKLSICPLVTGDLEIVGVRCKLFNELWVYHPFHVVGPLLQNTRMNRANRARGESYLLKSKIEHDMPSLTVDIVPHGGKGDATVLQGQISSWTLRISNLGTAPASNVTLKTNAPWMNIAQTNRKETRATSHCIGPSGTLMRLPLEKKTAEDGIDNDDYVKSDVISPGQTVEVPVHVRTSGGGRQELYMLFRYELSNGDVVSTALNSSSPSSSKQKWLRKMISVPVYPSLTLSAVLMPSYWKKREHILSIEMTNYRSDRQTSLEINLDKICIASRYYRVQQLPDQLGESDLYPSNAQQQQLYGMPASLLQIGWQERVTMHYLIIPFEDEEEAKYTLSQCHLVGENSNSSGTSLFNESEITDFVCLEHAHERFKTALDAHEKEMARRAAEQEESNQPRHVAQIRREKSSMESEKSGSSHSNNGQTTPGNDTGSQSSSGNGDLVGKSELSYHPTSIMNLCPPEESSSKINVICTWTAFSSGNAEDEVIYGQHHLRQLAVRPQAKSKGCPLTITANHRSEIEHDFTGGPMKMDIEVTVRNRLVESPVEFEFALERQADFELIGAERFRWTLDGGDEIVVPLHAIMSSSGIYNLQSLRLTVFVDNLQVPYLFPFQWIVKVNPNATI